MKPSFPVPPELSELLGVDLDAITFLRQSQNRVYSFTDREGFSRILRLTLESHRSRPEIEDELAWLCKLHAADLSVCPPVRNREGNWIHSHLDAEEPWHAVVFEKASGRALTKGDLSSRLYWLHGKHLGALHAFSKEKGGSDLTHRKSWDEERYFTRDLDNYLPQEVRVSVRQVWTELKSALESLPITKENHGPVHLDLGYSNFFINGDRLELFDFDNCALGYYASDIALALYGGIFTLLRCERPGDRAAFASPRTGENLEKVWHPFREGYRSENHWPDEWNEAMPLWFEMAYFRSVIHAFRMQFPVVDSQAKEALDLDLEQILTRKPPIRFDFRQGRALP